jgi:hypothetical protein
MGRRLFMGGDDSRGDAVTDGKACASAQARHLYPGVSEGSVMCLSKVSAEPIEVARPQRCHGSDGSVMERTYSMPMTCRPVDEFKIMYPLNITKFIS